MADDRYGAETRTQHWVRRGGEPDRKRKAELCAMYRKLDAEKPWVPESEAEAERLARLEEGRTHGQTR